MVESHPSRTQPDPEDRPIDRQFFEHVLSVAGRLASSSDLHEVLGLIIDALRDSLRADRASVFQYDATTNELFATQAHGLARDLRLPADKGIVGEAARTRRIVNIPDAYADPRFNPGVDKATGYRTRCLLTIPLVDFEGRLVGVAQVLNKGVEHGGIFSADDESMAQYLALQAAVALKRASLLEAQREKERLEADLQVARQIQRAGLPQQIAEFPGYDIAGHTEPADKTGGDSYDVIDLRPFRDRVATRAEALIFLADATGHGIGPALSVTQVQAMVRMGCRVGVPLDAMALNINQRLCEDLPAGRFVTSLLGHLDTSGNVLRYISAGQGPLLILRAGVEQSSDDLCLATTHMPFGIDDDVDFTSIAEVRFEPGDVFLALSDGYFEAQTAEGEYFGLDRVAEVVRSVRGQTAAGILDAVRGAVIGHMGSGAAADDQTGLIVKRLG